MRLFLAVLAATLSPSASSLTCDPLAHGAVGNGAVFDTDAVRAAVAECGAAGGGTVLFAAGYTFLTGAINVSSNTRLQVEGTLLASPNSTGYTLVDFLPWFGPNPPQSLAAGGVEVDDAREWQPFISTWHASNVSIFGGGVIDGNGAAWWRCAGNMSLAPCNGHARPHGIRFVYGVGFEITGVTIKDSPMWQVHPAFVSDVWIHDVTILAPDSMDKIGPSHNTDGIDPDCAENVLIERVYISTGDDNIAIKSGRNWFGRTFGRPSRNITVRDCVFGAGHGMSIGSEMSGGVYDVRFENISGVGMGTGIRIKSERGRGGLIANVSYANIRLASTAGQAVQFVSGREGAMRCSCAEPPPPSNLTTPPPRRTRHPTPQTLNYDSGLPPTNVTATPSLFNVTVDGLVSAGSKSGWLIDGLPESPLAQLTFRNVSIGGVPDKDYIVKCDYVQASVCDGVSPSCPPCIA